MMLYLHCVASVLCWQCSVLSVSAAVAGRPGKSRVTHPALSRPSSSRAALLILGSHADRV